MSIERDQSTRHQMRAGISGENVLPTLDVFTVTETFAEKCETFQDALPLAEFWMHYPEESPLRPLDEFSVTTTEKPDVPAGYWEALDMVFKAAVPLTEPGRDFYTYGFEATLWSVTPDGQVQIQPISHRTMMLDIRP